MPWMDIPFVGQEIDGPNNCLACWNTYYDNAVSEAATQNLPLNFIGTQWEGELSYDSAYYDLPPDQNPNVIGLDGTVSTTTGFIGQNTRHIVSFWCYRSLV